MIERTSTFLRSLVQGSENRARSFLFLYFLFLVLILFFSPSFSQSVTMMFVTGKPRDTRERMRGGLEKPGLKNLWRGGDVRPSTGSRHPFPSGMLPWQASWECFMRHWISLPPAPVLCHWIYQLRDSNWPHFVRIFTLTQFRSFVILKRDYRILFSIR